MICMKEKIQHFKKISLTILLDAALVIFVALMTKLTKYFIELIYGQKIEEIDNLAVNSIYLISKYLLITIFSIYAIFDIITELISNIKIIKNGK